FKRVLNCLTISGVRHILCISSFMTTPYFRHFAFWGNNTKPVDGKPEAFGWDNSRVFSCSGYKKYNGMKRIVADRKTIRIAAGA
ncbi:hypothetical protein ODQ90_27810, partial [Escherichia coli]|nr:hypothetical protein [Escherichia coli]